MLYGTLSRMTVKFGVPANGQRFAKVPAEKLPVLMQAWRSALRTTLRLIRSRALPKP